MFQVECSRNKCSAQCRSLTICFINCIPRSMIWQKGSEQYENISLAMKATERTNLMVSVIESVIKNMMHVRYWPQYEYTFSWKFFDQFDPICDLRGLIGNPHYEKIFRLIRTGTVGSLISRSDRGLHAEHLSVLSTSMVVHENFIYGNTMLCTWRQNIFRQSLTVVLWF